MFVLSVIASWQERRSYGRGMVLTLVVFMFVLSVIASWNGMKE